MATAPGLPQSYQSEIDTHELNRQLAAAMMQRGLTPVQGRMVGKHYVRSNPLQHLAQALNVWSGRTGMEAATKGIGQTKRRAATDEAAERAKILEAMSPKTVPFLSGDAGGTPEAQLTTPGDPMEAERRAFAAQFGGNRDLAKVLMENRMKRLDLGAKAASNESAVAAAQSGSPADLRPSVAPDIQTQTLPGGQTVAFTKSDKGKTNFSYLRPPTTISNDVRVGGKIEEKGVDYSLGQLKETKAQAQGAKKALISNQEALAALDQGAKTGITEPIQQVFRKLATDFGVGSGPDAPDLLASRLKQMVFDRLGGLGRQISDADRKFVEDASGSTMTDPVALRRILAITSATDMLTLSEHNRRVQALTQQYPQLAPALAADMIPWQYRPGQKADPMVEAVLQGKSTFDVLPAVKPAGLDAVRPGKKEPGSGGRALTPQEQQEYETLQKRLRERGQLK